MIFGMNHIANITSIKNADRITVFGAQAISCGIIAALIEVFTKVPEVIIVSDMKSNPTEIFGIKVIELNEASIYKDCLILISVPVSLHDEIISTLSNNGFTNYIAIDNAMEYELMSLYYRKSGRFALLSDIESVDNVSNVKIFMARSVFDEKISGTTLFNNRNILEIQAGAEITEDRLTELADNYGDNISRKNRYYSELTVTYWVWKNVKADYKGIFHYRRVLDISDDDYKGLGSADVVLPLPFVIYPNAASQFLRFIHEKEYNVLLSVLKETSLSYYVAAHKYWYEPYLYNYNILIAKETVFDSYCEFMFEILFKVQEFYVDKGIKQNERYLGYIGEILTSLYFMVNKKQLRIAHTKKLWLV
jgi:hypothetical protein